MKETVVMPQAAGHPVLQMNTLQFIAFDLAVLCKASIHLVCVYSVKKFLILFSVIDVFN